jgi:hypothetical protein
MNKYRVKISHLFAEIIEVEAQDQEEAKQKVLEIIQKDGFESKAQYETTLPAEHWHAISEEEFQQMVKDFQEKMVNAQEANKEESNIITPSIITP